MAVDLVEVSELAGNSDAAVPLSISHKRRFTGWLRSQLSQTGVIA
jgi:hypothetical protein